MIKSDIKCLKGWSSSWSGHLQPPHVIATSKVNMIMLMQIILIMIYDHVCAILPSGFITLFSLYQDLFDFSPLCIFKIITFCHFSRITKLMEFVGFSGSRVRKTYFSHNCLFLSPLCDVFQSWLSLCNPYIYVYIHIYPTCFAQDCVLKSFHPFHALSRAAR